jgi:PKD repeat protein
VALLLLVGPAAAALPPPAAAPTHGEVPGHAALDAAALLAYAPLPQRVRAGLLAALPSPLGDGGITLRLHDATGQDARRFDAPDGLRLSGEVPVDEDWLVVGNLSLENATLRFTRPDLAIDVRGTFTALDAELRTEGPGGTWDGEVVARGALEVRRSLFEGVRLTASFDPSFAAPSIVEASTFRDGDVGLAADRPNLEVAGSVFVNLTDGLRVLGAHGAPERGPLVHDSTFEMDRAGLHVVGASAGTYRANLARANALGVLCETPGAHDALGELHKPLFLDNDLYTNYGEALAGVRGLAVESPIGDLVVPNSACEHRGPYLGPPGDARDSVFLGGDDTLADVAASPHASAAPPLPLPLREVTDEEAWGPGDVLLDGPVVVNDPGRLTLTGAAVRGDAWVGAKANGFLAARHSAFGPFVTLVLRNDDDVASDVALGGPDALNPLLLYRCNCSVTDAEVAFGEGQGAMLAGGLLTDDTAWLPSLTRVALRGTPGRGSGVILADVKPTLDSVQVHGGTLGILNAVSTLTLRDSRVEGAELALGSLVGTTTSTGDLFASGTLGYAGLVDTVTMSGDVVTGFSLAMAPILPASFSLTGSNVTLNGAGLVVALGAATVATSNLVDNFLFALGTFPVDAGGVTPPTSVACTSCWAPPDESWTGNVTYAASPVPNDVPSPPWAAAVRVAGEGQVLDLQGRLAAPAVARSGGTLRVTDAELDLAGFPIGAKGGGPAGGATGSVHLTNATVRGPGFVGLNSTSSRIADAHFAGFLDAAVSMAWNGGHYACVEVEDAGAAFRYNLQRNGPLELGRLLVRNASGVVTGLVPAVQIAQDARVEDSAIVQPRGGGLLERIQPGDAQLHRSNLLGEGTGARDEARNLTGFDVGPFDARDTWWGDAAGPGASGASFRAGRVGPLLAPWSGAPHAPAPCAAFAVRTRPAVAGEPVAFEDRTIDASGLGITGRTWDFGDGSDPAPSASSGTEHTFARWGTTNVTLTAASASGAEASAQRSLRVLARPAAAFAAQPAAPAETDSVSFTDRSEDPDGRVVAWRWDFGDGASSASARPSHRFADGGAYAVTLTATDDDGLQAATAGGVDVSHVPPRADWTFTRDGRTARFADASTHPNPADAPPSGWQYAWDFGDGAGSAEQNPQHAYAADDAFQVTLEVTDDDGQRASLQRTVDLRNQPPEAGFDVAPSVPVAGGPTYFTDASRDPDGDVVAWEWDFGDGGGSAQQDPQHTYAAGGDYTVTLRAEDDRGAVDEASRALHVCETRVDVAPPHVHAEACTHASLQETLALVEGTVGGLLDQLPPPPLP